MQLMNVELNSITEVTKDRTDIEFDTNFIKNEMKHTLKYSREYHNIVKT
jgi:hypothetical protein